MGFQNTTGVQLKKKKKIEQFSAAKTRTNCSRLFLLWLVSGLCKPALCVERDAHQHPPDRPLLYKVTSPSRSQAPKPSLASTRRTRPQLPYPPWETTLTVPSLSRQRAPSFKGSSRSMGFLPLHVVSTKIQQGRKQPHTRRPRGLSQDPFTAPAAFRLASAALGTGSV